MSLSKLVSRKARHCRTNVSLKEVTRLIYHGKLKLKSELQYVFIHLIFLSASGRVPLF